jgi:AbrB family looped-hinge helix DNA binding protein
MQASRPVNILPRSYECVKETDTMKSAAARTRLSTKGQVILPKAIRAKRNWTPGTELEVRETPEGVLLTAAARFEPTRFEDVRGCLPSIGRTVSLEEMEEGILAEARRRHARD